MLSTGQLLQEFRIGETVEDCEGEAMKIESIVQRQQLGRKVQGIAAALLPFEADGRIAVEAFQNHLRATCRAGPKKVSRKMCRLWRALISKDKQATSLNSTGSKWTPSLRMVEFQLCF